MKTPTLSKAARKKKTASPNSKLISIRIPEEMIEELRGVAQKRDGVGYQQLIKSYISNGLHEESRTVGPAKNRGKKSSAVFQETMEAIATPVVSSSPAQRALHMAPVIYQDIRELAGHLKPYKKFFEGKRFLITGAFGFLGRYMVHLLQYLNENILKDKAKALLLDNFVTGYEQSIISDESLKFIRHDVTQPFSQEGDLDYIIHGAGIASPVYYTKFPIETMDVGTVGTRNMLELARSKNVQGVIFMSSSEVYGDPDPAHVPTTEEYNGNVSVSGPRSCYDESKRFGETMCYAYAKVYNVPVKIIRPFNAYGPGIRPDDYRVLPNFIEHALRKEPLPVHGGGRNTRSFCYINDMIEGIFRVLFSPHTGEAFNVGNPLPEISVRDLAKKVAALMPFKVEVRNIDPPHAVYSNSDPKRRCPDISKISKLTGFKPRYDLDEGLKRTIQWFSQF